MIPLGLAPTAEASRGLAQCVSNGHGSQGGGVSAYSGTSDVKGAGRTGSVCMGHAPSDAVAMAPVAAA
jgi:hypothetical protein